MSAEIVGITVASLEETIRYGLQGYSDISEGTVDFDIDEACKLELTPDKPNSARSATAVKYLGEAAATLYVIAFAPGDGTGDESHQKLADVNTGDYPRAAKVASQGTAACPAGTCHVWKVEGYEGNSAVTIYVDTATNRISQVVAESAAGTSTIVYDYKDVTVIVPTEVSTVPIP